MNDATAPRTALAPGNDGGCHPQTPGGGLDPAGTFEESTRRLSQIVAELEGGDLPLERSLELFEEGVRVARSAQDRLDRAERRVEELLGIDEQGKPLVREFEG